MPAKSSWKFSMVTSLPLRHVPQVAARSQVNGGWELGKEGFGDIEIDVNRSSRFSCLISICAEDHAANLMFGMRQGQETIGEQVLLTNRFTGHVGEFVPGHALCQFCRGPTGIGFGPRDILTVLSGFGVRS